MYREPSQPASGRRPTSSSRGQCFLACMFVQTGSIHQKRRWWRTFVLSDLEQTWNTPDPQFSPCFEQTVLVWAPCLFLWVLAPFEAIVIVKSKCRDLPWGFTNTTKLLLNLVLIAISAVTFIMSVVQYMEGKKLYPGELWTHAVKTITFVLAAVILVWDRVRGVHTSGGLFVFWLVLSVAGVFQFRTELRQAGNTEETRYKFILYMVYYPIVLLMLILNVFADPPPRVTDRRKTENPYPADNASFLSLCFFSWFSPLIWQGYKKPLTLENLWNLRYHDTSAYVVAKFEKQWNKLQKQSIKFSTRERQNQLNGILKNRSNKPKKPVSVIGTMFRTYWIPMVSGALLKIVSDALALLSPYLLYLMIKFVESKDYMWKGILYAICIFVASEMQTLCLHHSGDIMYNFGVNWRTTIMSAIYKKALRISSFARKTRSFGEIVNVMAVDAQRLVDTSAFLHLTWINSLSIIACLCFLWNILGEPFVFETSLDEEVFNEIIILNTSFELTGEKTQHELADTKCTLLRHCTALSGEELEQSEACKDETAGCAIFFTHFDAQVEMMRQCFVQNDADSFPLRLALHQHFLGFEQSLYAQELLHCRHFFNTLSRLRHAPHYSTAPSQLNDHYYLALTSVPHSYKTCRCTNNNLKISCFSALPCTMYRRKAGPAYSSSTLSMRYNSDTADLTWVCVFCKRGPHCMGPEPMGDLFGPYRIPAMPHGDELSQPGVPSDREVVEEQKRRGGGKHAKSLRASGTTELFTQKLGKKSKRSQSTDGWEVQAGLLQVEGGYEVWLHGTCAMWAPGLCMIGSQMVGLDDAIWTSLRTRCSQCGELGAGVGCVVRNCPLTEHYHCATASDWLLDTETYIARCPSHRTVRSLRRNSSLALKHQLIIVLPLNAGRGRMGNLMPVEFIRIPEFGRVGAKSSLSPSCWAFPFWLVICPEMKCLVSYLLYILGSTLQCRKSQRSKSSGLVDNVIAESRRPFSWCVALFYPLISPNTKIQQKQTLPNKKSLIVFSPKRNFTATFYQEPMRRDNGYHLSHIIWKKGKLNLFHSSLFQSKRAQGRQYSILIFRLEKTFKIKGVILSSRLDLGTSLFTTIFQHL
ncbi:Canalicular multispecific organic anion transporter 1 [Homalodisca vitripennis]|nr:Canalicular multispecific organic anion transporter 1 [Homalodisca vitripennis]